MSTIKADAVTALSAGGDLSLDGLGTGGVSIASTLKMTKGGDISSASPLVIDTDGNYFDVTGTTNFAAMTVESGNFFMLQFDSALTITHGSGIELPGAANLTTATGDRLICYATAANTVEVMSVETEAAASSGGFKQIVNSTTGAVATTTTLLVWDDTIPQKTEGGEFLTLAITPSNSSNRLVISVQLQMDSPGGQQAGVALFQDTTANALAVAQCKPQTTYVDQIYLEHFMLAGTTSETTFKVRAGMSNAGTFTVNGDAGSRNWGGVATSSITIVEYAAA